jgi:predicted DNA repair protein MutK
VTLSSSEAELYALVEAAKEVKFAVQVLMTMGIYVRLPVIIKMDNVGAIFMAENNSISQRTKHIDIHQKWVTQYIDDGFHLESQHWSSQHKTDDPS